MAGSPIPSPETVAGFVKVQDERTLLIPNAPGNNASIPSRTFLATDSMGLSFLPDSRCR